MNLTLDEDALNDFAELSDSDRIKWAQDFGVAYVASVSVPANVPDALVRTPGVNGWMVPVTIIVDQDKMATRFGSDVAEATWQSAGARQDAVIKMLKELGIVAEARS